MSYKYAVKGTAKQSNKHMKRGRKLAESRAYL